MYGCLSLFVRVEIVFMCQFQTADLIEMDSLLEDFQKDMKVAMETAMEDMIGKARQHAQTMLEEVEQERLRGEA